VCLEEYLRNAFNTCPVCKKSILEDRFRDREIASYLRHNPMPDEYKGYTATILCNDCVRYSNTPWHFMFHQCSLCGSYNTDLVTKTKDGEEAKLPPNVHITDPSDLPPGERYVPPADQPDQADHQPSVEELMALFEEHGEELLLGEGEDEGEGEDDGSEGDDDSEGVLEGDDDDSDAGEDEAEARENAE